MGMSQSELTVIGGTQIAIGLSQVIRVVAGAYQYSTGFKYSSGGSLEIVTPQPSGASTGASVSPAWGKGYLMGTAEVCSWDGPAAVYLCATGATAIAMFSVGYGSGASLP